jgi:toxin CptA
VQPAPPLRLELKPSRWLAGTLALGHGLAGYAAWTGLSSWARVPLLVVLLASLGVSLARALLRFRGQAISLELQEDGRASIKDRSGIWQEGRLGENHFVSPALVVVDLQTPSGRRKRLVLAPDSLPADDFRRLRVWLRWRRSPLKPSVE